MLSLKQIESFYPEYLRPFKKNLLREYLQYKILEFIFDSRYGENLAFMGGTALRVIHSNDRFSEDLDFDNRGLTQDKFELLTDVISKKLRYEGYTVEVNNVFKGAYRSYVKITNILYEYGISNHKNEKLLIQVDTEPQRIKYNPEKVIINKFDVFIRVNTVPSDMLLSQKIACIFTRKRPMGRDFYDVVFLTGRTGPDWTYLKLKLKISDETDLKDRLLAKCEKYDFKQLSRDIEPFLITPGSSKKILYFTDFIKETKFK